MARSPWVRDMLACGYSKVRWDGDGDYQHRSAKYRSANKIIEPGRVWVQKLRNPIWYPSDSSVTGKLMMRIHPHCNTLKCQQPADYVVLVTGFTNILKPSLTHYCSECLPKFIYIMNRIRRYQRRRYQ